MTEILEQSAWWGDPPCSVICFDFFNKMKIFEIMKGDKAR